MARRAQGRVEAQLWAAMYSVAGGNPGFSVAAIFAGAWPDGKNFVKNLFVGKQLRHLMAAIFGVSWRTDAFKAGGAVKILTNNQSKTVGYCIWCRRFWGAFRHAGGLDDVAHKRRCGR